MFVSQSLKQRFLPLCAFLGAFTTVMTILVFSTDLKGRRYRRGPLNLSVDSDFQNVAQDDPQLINYIRERHLNVLGRYYSHNDNVNNISVLLPVPEGDADHQSQQQTPSVALQSGLAEILTWKRGGTFVEAGAYRHGDESRTDRLESELGWRGLLTQPDPHDYLFLEERARGRPRSHIMNVCLSPTTNPKKASFKRSSSSVENSSSQMAADGHLPLSLATVPCFPLYSLLLAYGTTDLDFLVLDAERAEYEVLRTVPFDKVNIRVIGVTADPLMDKIEAEVETNMEEGAPSNTNIESWPVLKLLSGHGYEHDGKLSTPKMQIFTCSKPNYSGCSSPMISI